jgi:hypothetical protein
MNKLENYKGDKRSKEYRKLKEDHKKSITYDETKNKRLGDKVESVLKATGIKKAVSLIFGDDCGCDDRRKKWNMSNLGSVKQVNCMSEKNFKDYTVYINNRKENRWEAHQVDMLFKMYKDIFGKVYNRRRLCSNCGATGKLLKSITEKLDSVYNQINDTNEL